MLLILQLFFYLSFNCLDRGLKCTNRPCFVCDNYITSSFLCVFEIWLSFYLRSVYVKRNICYCNFFIIAGSPRINWWQSSTNTPGPSGRNLLVLQARLGLQGENLFFYKHAGKNRVAFKQKSWKHALLFKKKSISSTSTGSPSDILLFYKQTWPSM